MKIKYYNFQKWLIFTIILIPMILWSLSAYFYLDGYFEEKKIAKANVEIDQLANQVFLNLENCLRQMTFTQKMDSINQVVSIKESSDFLSDLDQSPASYEIELDSSQNRFIIHMERPDSKDPVVQYMPFESIHFSNRTFNVTSNEKAHLKLGEMQIVNDDYYKAVRSEKLNLEIVVKIPVENELRPSYWLWGSLVILVNIVIFLLFNSILKRKQYPLNQLIKILDLIKKGQYKKENRIQPDYDGRLEQLIDEIIEIEADLEKEIETLKASCEKYRADMDALLEKSKALKREHDQYFTDMATKEALNDVLFDAINEIIFIINKEGIILEVNCAFENKLGFKREEIVGKSILSIVMDNSKALTDLTTHYPEPLFLNFRMNSFDSQISQFLNVKVEALTNGSYLYVGKSINDEIALQSRILRKNRELEYINQINSSLISNWGLKELLINIINRIDYLFNIVSGTIRIKNDDGVWELKAQTEKGDFYHEMNIKDINAYYESDVILDSEIKIIDVDDTYREKHHYSESLKQILIAPMETDGEIISILSIGIEHELTSNDINILKMFKNQASVVIQRALLYDQLRKQYFNTIHALVNVIEAKDKYTEGHSRRVSRFSVEIALEMGYSNEELENIEIAGLLHDVGKVGIHQSILTKQGKLSQEEYEIIKEHPEKGIQILKSIKLDSQIVEGILYHHVRYDLKGYPSRHTLKELPEYAAIIGVADAFDAITSERSYSKAKTIFEALEELIRNRGTQFSPIIIDAFERILKKSPDKIQNIIDDLCL
ncbi:HD-GYP domain-containing protein [Fusibacter ferrireducens]|uniref:HD domain-containing protein n=1 Tax=Fusibacter ferrireducens TaxID=2785058 RepID=A0ABR9ZYC1_9FIRM|nr:HD domain-containing phosphohydrolase [Fusibacter ferrireducens]MBF4695454.1 HD domain-containing protein [Fusibacter ferrireducens]